MNNMLKDLKSVENSRYEGGGSETNLVSEQKMIVRGDSEAMVSEGDVTPNGLANLEQMEWAQTISTERRN